MQTCRVISALDIAEAGHAELRLGRKPHSAVDKPGSPSSRRPSFLSARAIQLRIDRAVSSNSRARSAGSRPARTRPTIQRRNSGEYAPRVFGMITSLAKAFGVSTNPRQSQSQTLPRGATITASARRAIGVGVGFQELSNPVQPGHADLGRRCGRQVGSKRRRGKNQAGGRRQQKTSHETSRIVAPSPRRVLGHDNTRARPGNLTSPII